MSVQKQAHDNIYDDLYERAECYTDERWGRASGHAWDRMDQIVAEYFRGERTLESAHALIDDTRNQVYEMDQQPITRALLASAEAVGIPVNIIPLNTGEGEHSV